MRDVWNCHCGRCRRFTGHYMAATSAPVGAVVFEADESLRWYSPHATVEYGFCGVCGASLFWRRTDRDTTLGVCAGCIDQPTGLRTVKSWWTAEHADYHEHAVGVEEIDYEDRPAIDQPAPDRPAPAQPSSDRPSETK